MYNAEQKERYIEERVTENVNIRKAMATFFSYTEPFEEQYQKDCSLFSTDEIISMYS